MAKNKKVNENLANAAASAEADHELQMARSQLYKIAQYSIKLHEMMKQVTDPNGIEAWQAAKITKAADYMGAVYHDLEYKIKFEQEGGELGAAAPGEIAVGETKKYGKMKETNDPYVRKLRNQLKLKEKAVAEQAQSDTTNEAPYRRSRPSRFPTGNIGDTAKQTFKRREMDAELGDEEAEIKRKIAAKKDLEAGPWYIAFDGKVWKKNGQPVEFNGKEHARKTGLKLMKKMPEKDIKITWNPDYSGDK